jgi:hypothetical protein
MEIETVIRHVTSCTHSALKIHTEFVHEQLVESEIAWSDGGVLQARNNLARSSKLLFLTMAEFLYYLNFIT